MSQKSSADSVCCRLTFARQHYLDTTAKRGAQIRDMSLFFYSVTSARQMQKQMGRLPHSEKIHMLAVFMTALWISGATCIMTFGGGLLALRFRAYRGPVLAFCAGALIAGAL